MHKSQNSILLCFSIALTLSAQSITLLETPQTLQPGNVPVRVTWEEAVECGLNYGTNPDGLNRQLPVTGTRALSFIPDEMLMPAGLYFGQLTAGTQRSRVFWWVVEHDRSPQMQAPANNATLNRSDVELQWTAVPGVPWYHVIVSDQEVKLEEDNTGELQLQHANVVWQAITPDLSIYYGDPDPSGQFNALNETAPPLAEGREYYWVVLNNYGGQPAFSSTSQSGIFSFRVNLDHTPQAPVLLQPAPGAHITEKEAEFTWQSGAHHAVFTIFEWLPQDGSESAFPVYRSVTAATSMRVPLRAVLKPGRYHWSVIAVDAQGNAMAGDTREFVYGESGSGMFIETRQTHNAGLPRTRIRVRQTDGPFDMAPVMTTENANFTLPLHAGTYELHASKPGFADTTCTVRVDAGETVSVRVWLRPCSASCTGSFSTFIPGSVTAHAFDSGQITSGLIAGNRFWLGLDPGLWMLEGAIHGDPVFTSAVTIMSPNTTLGALGGQKRFALQGTVLNTAGQPVIGAAVTCFGSGSQSAQSHGSGRFDIVLDEGTWDVQAVMPGMGPSPVRRVELNANTELSSPLILQSEGVPVTGRLIHGSAGIPRGRITAVPMQGPTGLAFSGSQGSFNLTCSRSQVVFYTEKPGYLTPVPLQLDLNSFSGKPIDIPLEPAVAEVTGSVTDTQGAPLDQVIVSAGDASDTTSADGFYRLFCRPGVQRIQSMKAGTYQEKRQVVTLQAGLQQVDIRLKSPGSQLCGVVRHDGTTLAMARISAVSSADTFRTRANLSGSFCLALPPGLYAVTAEAAGYDPAIRTSLALAAGQTLTGIDFQLNPGAGQLYGTVKNQLGIPVNGWVSTSRVRTICDGLYLMHLRNGPEKVTVTAEGHETVTKTVVVGSDTRLDFVLNALGTWSGKVTDPQGHPLWEAEVLVTDATDTVKALTDFAGEFNLAHAAGTFPAMVDLLGYQAWSGTVTLSSGQTLHQTVTLSSKPDEIGSIAGRIVSTGGSGLPGVRLNLTGQLQESVLSENPGTYEFPRLARRNGRLIPSKPAWFFVPRKREYNPLNGHLTQQNFSAGRYGDISRNDAVSSYDGSLALRISAGQVIQQVFKDFPRDSLAADVSGNGDVSAFDGSLIFRYSVGLIGRFPAEEPSLGRPQCCFPSVIAEWDEIRQDTVWMHLSVRGMEVFYSLDACVQLPVSGWQPVADRIRVPEGVHTAVCITDGRLNLSLASIEPLETGDRFCSIPLSDGSEPASAPHLIEARVDEYSAQCVPEGQPQQFRVLYWAPNPFNASMTLRFWVPESLADRPLSLSVTNILGQKLWEIHRQAAPGLQQITWSGRDGSDRPVASGVYILRLRVHQTEVIKKAICIR